MKKVIKYATKNVILTFLFIWVIECFFWLCFYLMRSLPIDILEIIGKSYDQAVPLTLITYALIEYQRKQKASHNE